MITCAVRARGLLPSLVYSDRHYPSVSHGSGALSWGKGFGKTMNTFYAIIYIVAASVMIVTVAFFVVVTALT